MKVGIAAVAFAVAGVLFAISYNAYSFGWIGKPEPTLFANLPEPQEVEPLLERPRGKNSTTQTALPLRPSMVLSQSSRGRADVRFRHNDDRRQRTPRVRAQERRRVPAGASQRQNKLQMHDQRPAGHQAGAGRVDQSLVTWKTSVARSSKFRQTARIMTNDRTQPTITLTITGDITVLLRSVPSYVSFEKVTPNEEKTVEFKLHSYHLVIAQLEVESFDFEHPETAKNFDVTFEPAPPRPTRQRFDERTVGQDHSQSQRRRRRAAANRRAPPVAARQDQRPRS